MAKKETGFANLTPDQQLIARESAEKPPVKGTRVTTEEYNVMSRAYFEDQSTAHVARAANVSPATATRYIEVGDPSRGMPPIKQRFLDSQRRVQAKLGRSWEVAMREDQKLLLRAKAALMTAVGKLQSVKLPQEITLEQAKMLADVMDKVIRTESFVLGGPDSRNSTATASEESFEGWSDEEVIEYIQSGKRPAGKSN